MMIYCRVTENFGVITEDFFRQILFFTRITQRNFHISRSRLYHDKLYFSVISVYNYYLCLLLYLQLLSLLATITK